MKYMVNLRENLALSISKQLELALSGVRKDEREEKRPLQVAKISFAWIDMHFEHFQFNCVQGAILW